MNPPCATCGRPVNKPIAKHCSKKCSRNNPATIEKQKATCLSRYGVSSVMLVPEISAKRNFSLDGVALARKAKLTKIAKGLIIDDNDRPEFERYRRAVRAVTRRQPVHLLENHNYRGRIKGSYSLDHRFSIQRGFEENVDPEIIGHLVNLEYIPVSANCAKMSACSVEKEELFSAYHKYSGTQVGT